VRVSIICFWDASKAHEVLGYKYMIKNIKAISALLAGLFFNIAVCSPAFAQTPVTNILLTDKNGCKLHHEARSSLQESSAPLIGALLLNIAGDCVNGFFQGDVVYGIRSKFKRDNEPTQERTEVRVGTMDQGRFEKLFLMINGNLVTLVNLKGGGFEIDKGSPRYDLQRLVNAIQIRAAEIGGVYAEANRDHLTTIANLWDRNPQGMINTYTQDASNTRIASNNSAPPSSQQSGNMQASTNSSNTACWDVLAKREKEYEAINRRPVPAGVAPGLQRVMWMTADTMKIIDANCAGDEKAAKYRGEIQTAFNQSKTACERLSGSICIPNAYESSTGSEASAAARSEPRQSSSNSNSSPPTSNRNTSEDEIVALTNKCTAEGSAMVNRGTQEANRIMSTSRDARAGFRVMANALMENMKMYQGRCRPATNSTGNIAQSAKLLLQISQSCAAAGFGSDCDEMRKAAQAPTPSASSGNSSGGSSGGGSSASASIGSADNTRPAGDCLSAVRRASGGIDLQNNCGYAVEAGWCVIGYDCKNGDWGYSNQWTIGAGRSYPISGSLNRMVNFAACTPTQTSVISTSRTEYQCGR
jgi:hypothetical protein